MQSELTAVNRQAIINNLYLHSIQESYKDICDLTLSELMPTNSPKFKKCSHPWWNSTLNQLKLDLRQCQKAWLKRKNNSQLNYSYQILQKTFDKAVKKPSLPIRRTDKYNYSTNISMTPNISGRNFKQIGIHSERKIIPNQVTRADGGAISKPNSYLHIWKVYFSSLYNQVSSSVDSNLPTLSRVSPDTSHCLELKS